MQLSYNIIKKRCVNSNEIYTVKPPLMAVVPPPRTEGAAGPKTAQEAKVTAQHILDAADSRAKDILDSALQDAEGIKRDAYAEACRKGYNEGLRKGMEEGLKKTEDIRAEADKVLEEAHRISREYIRNEKDEIINLALYMAERIIGCRADVDDSIIIKITVDAIESAVVKEQVIIRVNPMDYAVLDSRRYELSKAAGDNTIVNIIKDGGIKRGGCRLETGLSTVDATIDTQLEKIKNALMG